MAKYDFQFRKSERKMRSKLKWKNVVHKEQPGGVAGLE